ncbi:Transposase [Oopsacas minuta]|uniref:Transposase n=1 Tax=Oopsacas minuta TaxID=111878 RepID=A0AAV7JI82_9METZ|nr:Transposase [Oopsacas minuta]
MARLETSKSMIDLYMSDPDDFHARLITGDETWIYYHDPCTVSEAAEWKHEDSPKPKVPRLGHCPKSKSKLMLSIFWDSKGPLLLDYLPKNTTVTVAYYANLMAKLRESTKKNRRGMLKRIPLILHANVPSHKSHIAQEAMKDCDFKQAQHPPYSPDLAPSDYYLFPIAKKALRGKILTMTMH